MSQSSPSVISPAPMHSACYVGTLRHRRHLPKTNHFSYKLFMAYLDLDELDSVFALSPWWRRGRPALARFLRRDYLAPHDLPLDQAVRQRVCRETGHYPTGPIRMLTHLRHAGYCFNPVTFYYGYNQEDTTVEWILAEITNTPWNERHSYFLPRQLGTDPLHWSFPKAFHVSPFNGMEQGYRWTFSSPAKQLAVHMVNTENGEQIFDATLSMRRLPMRAKVQQRLLLTHPLLTIMIILRIHLQALRLWWKGVPFHPHPRHSSLPAQPAL